MMELQLGLALCGNSRKGYNLDDFKIGSLCMKKGGSSDQILDVQDENDVKVVQTLPLLVWDKVDDHQNNETHRYFSLFYLLLPSQKDLILNQ